LAVVFVAISFPTLPAEATPPCTEVPGRYAKPGRIPPFFLVPSDTKVMCGLEPKHVLQRVTLSKRLKSLPDASTSGVYLVDADYYGWWLWDAKHPDGDPSRPYMPNTRSVWEVTPVGDPLQSTDTETRAGCVALPVLQSGATYIAFDPDAVESRRFPDWEAVHASIQTRTSPATPTHVRSPMVPDVFKLLPERSHEPCVEHGAFVADLQKPTRVWSYAWETHDSSGALVQRGMGPAPYAIGNAHEGSFEAPMLPPYRQEPIRDYTSSKKRFVQGERYTMTVRAVGWDGEASEPTQVSFTFQKTGDGRTNPFCFLGGVMVLMGSVMWGLIQIGNALKERSR
jgi:hypothetical protein